MEFKNLLDYSAKTWSPIVLPQMVIDELCRLYEIEIKRAFSSAQSRLKELNGLMFDRKYILLNEFDSEQLSIAYKDYVKSKLGYCSLKELPIKEEYWINAQERWRKSIKPFSFGRDAYRDTIIWLSILDHLQHNRYEDVAFITENYKDFGNQDGTDLHPYLREEANRSGCKLKIYRSLSELNHLHVDGLNFITDDWLSTNINWDRLDSKVLKGVSRIHCGYFFEDCARRLKDVFIETWEIIQANYHRDIEMFTVHRRSENLYSVWLQLGGVALINYISNNDQIYPLLTHFGAEVTIEIRNRKITTYEDHYYGENTYLELCEKETDGLQTFIN